MDTGTGNVSLPLVAMTRGSARPGDPGAKAAGERGVVAPPAWQRMGRGEGSRHCCCGMGVPFDCASAAAPLRTLSSWGSPELGHAGAEQAAELKQKRLQLPVLPGEVSEITASDAERHRAAPERPPVRHCAAGTRCGRR